MNEITGNIWDYHATSIIAMTTNGHVTRTGKAVMGRGVAAQAAKRFSSLPERLGLAIVQKGNHVHFLGENLVSFPVEHSPLEVPDLHLIERSARELVALAGEQGWPSIIVPRPGCGGGGLSWDEVRPLLAACFDDRFTVISAP
jgi:hypothetical protein